MGEVGKEMKAWLCPGRNSRTKTNITNNKTIKAKTKKRKKRKEQKQKALRDQIQPTQTKPNHTKSNQNKPDQTKPHKSCAAGVFLTTGRRCAFLTCTKNACAWKGSFRSARPLSPSASAAICTSSSAAACSPVLRNEQHQKTQQQAQQWGAEG